MNYKREVCEEIGNTFGSFYEDMAGFLIIDTEEQEYAYNSEDALLKDWLPKLKEADAETGDDYWADIIEYIEIEIE